MRRNDVIPLLHSPWREGKTVFCERNIPNIPFEQSTDTERPGGSSHIYRKILVKSLERLNSMVKGRWICKIKFHPSVEFKFASE